MGEEMAAYTAGMVEGQGSRNSGGMDGFGGGGFGGGRGMPATQEDVRAAVDQQTLISKLDQQTYGLADTFTALNNTLNNNFRGIDNAICTLGYQNQAGINSLSAQLAQCCCDTRAAIQENTTQGVMNTNAIQRQISDCCCDLEKMNMQNRFDAQSYNNNTLLAIDKLGDRMHQDRPVREMGRAAVYENESGGWDVRGTFGRDRQDPKGSDRITKEMAEMWTGRMRNEDGSTGPHWSMEQIKQLQQQKKELQDFELPEVFAVMNMMYSDYCKVAKKFNVNTVDFYVALATSWLDDKDAGEGKTVKYYEHVIQ